MTGAEPRSATAGRAGDGGFVKLIASLAPVLLAGVTCILLLLLRDSGVGILDVQTWPGTGEHGCRAGDTKCENLASYYAFIKIVTICAALLPLFSAFGYIPAVMKVVRSGRAPTRHGEILLYLAFASLPINMIWVFNIYLGYSHLGGPISITSGDMFIIVMFLIFLVIDLGLMRLHDAAAGGEREAEFDFFFGNAFFIDIPTLCGVVCIIIFSSLIVSTLGNVPTEITEAVAGAAIILHVVVSQVVFAFLLFQMKLKRSSLGAPSQAGNAGGVLVDGMGSRSMP